MYENHSKRWYKEDSAKIIIGCDYENGYKRSNTREKKYHITENVFGKIITFAKGRDSQCLSVCLLAKQLEKLNC